MKFNEAKEQMKNGKRAFREGQKESGEFLFHINGGDWGFSAKATGIEFFDTSSFICIKSDDNKLAPWFGSQEDIDAEDWCVIE